MVFSRSLAVASPRARQSSSPGRQRASQQLLGTAGDVRRSSDCASQAPRDHVRGAAGSYAAGHASAINRPHSASHIMSAQELGADHVTLQPHASLVRLLCACVPVAASLAQTNSGAAQGNSLTAPSWTSPAPATRGRTGHSLLHRLRLSPQAQQAAAQRCDASEPTQHAGERAQHAGRAANAKQPPTAGCASGLWQQGPGNEACIARIRSLSARAKAVLASPCPEQLLWDGAGAASARPARSCSAPCRRRELRAERASMDVYTASDAVPCDPDASRPVGCAPCDEAETRCAMGRREWVPAVA